MNIGDFFVTLGFNADTTKVKDFAKAIGDLPLDVAAGIAALAGLEQANVSAEAVAGSVSALERNMAEIRLGRGNIAPFQMLGIGINQNAFGVLSQLRERIKGLDRPTATNLISQMGINPEMINVLSMTNEQFEQLSKTVSGMTGEQEGSFLRAKQELVQFGQVARYVGFDVIAHVVDVIDLLIKGFRTLKIDLVSVGIVLAGVAIAFAPITAAVIGLMLVLDDFAVYFQGGNSVIGVAIDGIKKFGQSLAGAFSAPGIGKLTSLASIAGSIIGAPSSPYTMSPMGVPTRSITQINTIHVHSSAPAHEVGKAVKAEVDKGVSDAALQTDNGGY